jgi:hypothetical protein
MISRQRMVLLSGILLVLLIATGCTENSPPSSTAEPLASSDDATVVANTTPFPVPPTPLPEGPLGGIPLVPNVLVVAARQSQAELAAFLKTTPQTLRYVNPRLPEPVPPGTLVVIPPVYRSEGETLADVAEKTGFTLEVLQAVNLAVEADAVLPAETLLLVPPLYIVPESTPLGAAAAALGTDDGALLSANPELEGDDEILAGTVLVVPPTAEPE